ncbi:hypothetical protein SCALM49S_07008 [Streptomyces californicus]
MAQAATEAVTGAARTAPATIGDSEFDRDTAVSLREEGAYDAEPSAVGPTIHAVNRRLPARTLLGRALAEARPYPDPCAGPQRPNLTASAAAPHVIRTEGRPHRPHLTTLQAVPPEGRTTPPSPHPSSSQCARPMVTSRSRRRATRTTSASPCGPASSRADVVITMWST